MRSVIVGTAGHIDHGKTSLVRALTGVDADRLPEEKRRGITIDLGFAELDLGDVRVGFVDVPGHERFVKNMLAGAHGIDLVALVIAADEGVMPQTREHFDICRLLGVRSGLVVLTKADAVDEELLELVRAEAEELVAGSFLEGPAVVAASAAGLVQLRLESPIVALPGDRFILRTYSPQQTFAGGEVLDAHAPKHRGRERAAARGALAALASGDAAARLAFFVGSAGERGLRRGEAAARTGWRDDVLAAALSEALARGAVVEAEGILAAREVFERFLRAAVEEVEAHHRREPLSRGLARETLRERVFARAAPELFRGALGRAEAERLLVSERELVRARGHSLELSDADAALRDRLEAVYREAGLEAPTLEEAFGRADPGAGVGRREH